jgi:hypothetical protein
MGGTQCARRDLTCFVHTGMLYLTCSLGTFEDGNMYNMQRDNQDFDGSNLQCLAVLHASVRTPKDLSRANGMIRGNEAKVESQVVVRQYKITVKG